MVIADKFTDNIDTVTDFIVTIIAVIVEIFIEIAQAFVLIGGIFSAEDIPILITLIIVVSGGIAIGLYSK